MVLAPVIAGREPEGVEQGSQGGLGHGGHVERGGGG
jgi:hypothetical protein